MDMEVRREPRMTFSSLCEYLSATPVRQLSILREQKYPHISVIRGYSHALRQIQDYAVDGAPLSPEDGQLEAREQEVIRELVETGWTCPTSTATRPNTQQPPIAIREVEVSVLPDLLLEETGRKGPISGALKFYFTKSKELDAEVARWMASFLYQYRIATENGENAHPDLCMIYDVRRGEYYEAGMSHKRLFQNVDAACQIIAAMWGSL